MRQPEQNRRSVRAKLPIWIERHVRFRRKCNFFGFAICVQPVTRSTLNELYRVGFGHGLCRRLALTYSARGCGMGCSSWLVESQRFPPPLHGIHNRCCYFSLLAVFELIAD